MREGWMCVRCKTVNAPWMPNCRCVPSKLASPPHAYDAGKVVEELMGYATFEEKRGATMRARVLRQAANMIDADGRVVAKED